MICTVLGVSEFWIEHSWFGLYEISIILTPRSKDHSIVLWVGFVMAATGFILRISAEVKLGTNFTHVIRKEKDAAHELVTTGIYSIFRHPSYTGWFYYCIGREILLLNPINFLVTTITTWLIIYYRIGYS